MTAYRLPKGGRRIDRDRRLTFTFDGKAHEGLAGDTLASALLGSGRTLMGRSFKYHRPRGAVTAGHEEPNALMGIGQGARFEPNCRATVTPLHDGLTAISQNRWPSLDTDIGSVNAQLSRLLPAGFYYKMFMWPASFWKDVYEPFIRKSAGLGRPPEGVDADRYEHFHFHCDVAVVGGGVAGLQAALDAAEAGKRVLLMEQDTVWGGRSVTDGALDGVTLDGQSLQEWVDAAIERLEGMENVTLRLNLQGSGVYDLGYLTGYERYTDDAPGKDAPRHRLWRIRTQEIVTATGAIERPLAFANNDLPGVMLASAMRDMVTDYGVTPGGKVVVVTNNDDAYRTALALEGAGVTVAAVVDARDSADGDLATRARDAGIEIITGSGIIAKGTKNVEAVQICAISGDGKPTRKIACDAIAMSGGWSPVPHLWSHCGGKLTWDETRAFFAPDPNRPPTGADGTGMVSAVGAAAGDLTLGEMRDSDGAPIEADMRPVWIMPEGAGPELRAKMFLDYQNDVKVSDVQLAAREGFVSVEHAKRYTTLGMATDQGKLSNINGLAILAQEKGEPIPQTGTTTFRPPFSPTSMGAIAGEARGPIFQPLRRTPMHDWHDANGADWEPVGHWRRPYTYLRDGEDRESAVHREVKNARENLGLLDASTLGKIIVKGPDAGKFLDLLYTNMMSTLKVGRCRYGLMCNEQGFLSDDGVVARLSDDSFLCHTTTGGADRIHAHMEEWLQIEWWDMKVHTANVTEQWAQIAVVGPNARNVLQKLGGMDVSKDALKFMDWADGEIAGIPARVFRISFSGELSYEIAVPANRGLELWTKLMEAGEAYGVMPYGTEALHVLRAEKGFIMIGDETDGTVIPQDLNMHWAISKKKDDFIGKRGQERVHMRRDDRWKLVGLLTEDGSTIPDGAYAVAEGTNANGQRNTQGRITSSYHSPTLGRGIAMGLVLNGPDRMGETIDFPGTDGTTYTAKIVDPVFFDPEGEKQNV
ncbi:Aminomethyltransferase [Rhodobacteraceae bacterium THAF1]|uniref:sarcosine oxidase subunit alpha family protein n=1 Tax=Palleronia sp. THAF1 TaxID=2587842 RepID=UPI000F3CDEBC|nr:sarcosine oxidase subunit alpha family protein [Palleronia sp. THAF1]QFU08464.1 Aminomethyltransferase [Palleronia sp. THAF1]VDC29371.1 Aminomethyltransferase [Rhodobacteraceae bacterium THAF1]